ncbi:MAG TPA: methylenetetrahydrofolate--tRNA-(uracil(54)-C(5))-methyltransferase (FADH(2)-oxidizing) TrmFO [Bacillota bacterium]|nr:methylenetetrahydrofolate--tRNA-(uracil(54)-C(5))-methyltransferase (FADH(2)-oxidizing) TrmFO [Bacillota bacterium]HQE66037.1 methylenetetrahydrofolate--tRNA-(uracil(54)-C(5))-methyltransferase (FADH(2)-oxidizing) TrmFO [Bacillota bacterium]HQI15998.1 methylenetetrahydrofolate--tRNA-(uracil(54)-C(5))-methyltransferase (FADH(2)-oxidizing) TrmFO [Bacillota bacterium]HQJ37971.1 methylenetetrahydrofolate--tRNA-(uracil(54)-C(5))-methyltransferase (FADH(2)-oxidizing) TrmFO [Bacillota bacterium]HQL
MNDKVIVIGAGLAGSEAAWQLAKRGIKVRLYEMRPVVNTPAHHTDKFGELVCSNSLRSNQLENAVGLLKEEMRRLGSLIMECADSKALPAGGALAVDREGFSQEITDRITGNSNIEIIREEVTSIPENEYVIVATGPLTSEKLSFSIGSMMDNDYLYFYDAAAPIVTYESINKDKVFMASRYDKGDSDYINCPMTEEEYVSFHKELVNAETAPLKSFEKEVVFEGCMPVETMAKRGLQTLLFGPLKPVGLTDPRNGKQPYAVVQLRRDNKEGTLYNIVGFQTHLKWGEQKRVFGMIPGLENAEFVRYGVMHRNTFINSPKVMRPTLQFHNNEKLFFAGQMTGVEGYVESASSGLVAGINMARIINDMEPVVFPETTAHGALCRYITDRTIKTFQPMNVNFGIFPQPEYRIRNKKEKSSYYAERALKDLEKFIQEQL